MKDSDRDLIAALAEGSLPPDHAAELEARIDDDPEAQAELEAQRAALAALSTATPPQLTEVERAELHRALSDQLGLVAEPEPVRRRRFRFKWGGIAVAAAAVFVVVLIAPLTSLLTTSGDALDEVALAPATATTVAAQATEADDGLTQRGALGADAPAATEAPVGTQPPETAARATTQPAATTAASEAAPDVLLEAGDFTSDELELYLSRFFADSQGEYVQVPEDELVRCEPEAAAVAPVGSVLRPLATVNVDGADAIVWGQIDDPTLARVLLALATADCSVLAIQVEPSGR